MVEGMVPNPNSLIPIGQDWSPLFLRSLNSSFFTDSWCWMKSSARHTLSNQQAQVKQPETVNLIENVQSDTSKAPCCCFENAPNTALTIVCTINVSIDCKKNEVSSLLVERNILYFKSRQQVAWFVFCFRIKLCAKMMFSLLLQLEIVNENLNFVP